MSSAIYPSQHMEDIKNKDNEATMRALSALILQQIQTPNTNSSNDNRCNVNSNSAFHPISALYPFQTIQAGGSYTSLVSQLPALQRMPLPAGSILPPSNSLEAVLFGQGRLQPQMTPTTPSAGLMKAGSYTPLQHYQHQQTEVLFNNNPIAVQHRPSKEARDHNAKATKTTTPGSSPAPLVYDVCAGVAGDTASHNTSRNTSNAITIQNNDHQESTSSPKIIRRDEVEAALRSKPQRGKKRDNLNFLERLELTRSRNREHAKSTRNRKKARYDELLRCEQKLIENSKLEELHGKRQRTIIEFVNGRENMLRCLLEKVTTLLYPTSTNTSNNDTAANEDESNDTATSKEASQRQQLDSQEPKQHSPLRYVDYDDLQKQNVKACAFPTILKDTVDKEEEFELRITGRTTDETGLSGKATSKMNAFDSKIVSFIIQRYGKDVVQEVGYRIAGGDDGVAINKDGIGFAHVDLTLVIDNVDEKEGQQERHRDDSSNASSCTLTIQSSVVSFHFAGSTSPSDRLCAVEWCIMDGAITNGLSKN